MIRWIVRGVAVLVAIYIVFTGAVYAMMRANPGAFNQFMARLPMPLMIAVPFRPLWFHARAGALEPGQAAPDFELQRLHSGERVRLSSFHGQRPVMLVFGSYT
jgi:hypothetical protein